MKLNLMNTKSGFTLVEMMFALSLFTIVIGGTFSALMAGQKSWNTQNDNYIQQSEIRNAVSVISQDLRVAETITISQNPNVVSVSFFTVNDGPVSYSWRNSGAFAQMLIRQTTASQKVVAQNVTNLTFVEDGDNIFFTVTSNSGNTEPLQITKKVSNRT